MAGDTNERDRKFDPWRRPATERAWQEVASAMDMILAKERESGKRKRARKKGDRETLEVCVAALLSDAIHRELSQPGGWIMLSLSNQVLGRRNRYGSPALSRMLPGVMRALAPEYLIYELGEQGAFGSARLTRARIAPFYRDFLKREGIGLGDLCVEASSETIILKARKSGPGGQAEHLDYKDNARTKEFRRRMERINRRLQKLDIGFDGADASGIDFNQRRLTRVFNNGRFNQGGRLFGGFWMNMRKPDRGMNLWLGGDVVATVDYRQMMPRLLYAKAGVAPPADCYAVPGYDKHRPGWKMLLNAMTFSGRGLGKYPKGVKQLMPPRMKVAEAVRLLLAHNAPIAHLIAKDVGFKLMFQESEILVDVLLKLEGRNIAALPIHDAVIVPEGRADEAAEVMRQVFQKRTGLPGEVSIEPWYAHHQPTSSPNGQASALSDVSP